MSNTRAYEEEKSAQENNDQKINGRDCAGSAFRPFLNPRYRGIDQIGKKYGEQKRNQRATGNIKKSHSYRKQKYRE